MAVYRIQAPDGSEFDIEGPDDATEQEISAFAEQQFGQPRERIQSQGGPPENYNPIDEMSGGQRFMAGVGMGMSRIGRGVGQAVGLVDQAEIDRARELEAPLEATTAGKVGNVAGAVAALVPTAFIPGANTVAGAAAIGAGTGALATEGGLKERAIGAVGGTLGGAGGILAGRGIAKGAQVLGERAARVGSENAVRNQSIQAARQAGYILPPSEMAQSGLGRFVARAAEGVAGKAAMGQQASVTNQRVTNDLIRRELGVTGKGQISEAEIEAVKRPLFEVYERAAGLSQDAAEAVKNWRNANTLAKRYGKEVRANYTVAAEDAANAAKAEAQQHLLAVEQEAIKAGRAGLAKELAAARVQLGKIGTVEEALNEATGDVSAQSLRRAMDRGVPLSGNLKKVARFAQGFDRYAQAPKTTNMPGVSKLDFVLGAGGMVPFGAPGLALAAAPTITRNALLSRPVQALARPGLNPGATRLRLANSLRSDRALSGAGVSGNALSRR